jgi:hypothetical protein
MQEKYEPGSMISDSKFVWINDDAKDKPVKFTVCLVTHDDQRGLQFQHSWEAKDTEFEAYEAMIADVKAKYPETKGQSATEKYQEDMEKVAAWNKTRRSGSGQ